MLELIIAFLTSYLITLWIIRYKHLHQRYSADRDLSGPQKFHHSPVPRIGGISIICGLLAAIILKIFYLGLDYEGFILLICAVPTFAIGLAEDLTKKISIKQRLLLTALSGAIFIYLMGPQVYSFGIPFLDFLFFIPFFGIAFTIFAITGLANAYNIIDGFNGLSSMVGIITSLAIAYVAFCLDDKTITFLSLIIAAAILGFFIWNYPRGLIFLGDGGAYLIGFWIAALSIWLSYRHAEISPWFALLVNGYPTIETLFTIYRRKIHRGKNVGNADGIHFHTLIYRRVLQVENGENAFSANARTAPYLWVLTGFTVVPSVLWWQSTFFLLVASALFMIFYLWLYKKIVRFKTPSWLGSESP
jgi:UDP-GlcNAc:undecaprenyl-phosphate/decaprenyl-phosphate GlcNAc-1-phosphate transferase